METKVSIILKYPQENLASKKLKEKGLIYFPERMFHKVGAIIGKHLQVSGK